MLISGVIITFNEERNIERSILSLQKVCDEIIIVDSFSTDKTKEICLKHNVVFIEQKFLGYGPQKNFANEKATHDYVLSLDADEELSEGLVKEILKIKALDIEKDQKELYDAYSFNRLNNYCGRGWVRHSGWYPDTKIRLWHKDKAYWGKEIVHETVVLREGARLKWIKGDILHYIYYSISEHINTINKYSDLSAQEYLLRGKKSNLFIILYKSWWKFFRDYFLKGGFLDGFTGFEICKYSALSTFMKYSKLRELIRNQKKKQ